jgi:hypothetical protein
MSMPSENMSLEMLHTDLCWTSGAESALKVTMFNKSLLYALSEDAQISACHALQRQSL